MPLRRLSTSLVLLLLLAPSLHAESPQLTLDVLFTPDAHGAAVENLSWRPGHAELLGRWDDDGPEGSDTEGWWLFTPDGEKSLLARPADLGVAEAEDATLSWSEDGRHLLVQSEGFALFDVEKKSLRPMDTKGGEDPKLSPDGQRLAFVRDAELHLVDLEADTAQARRLTHDGEPGTVFNGTTDWVYWEEIWGRSATGFWWSPDSRRIAYYHLDDRDVPIYTLVDTRPLYPELERQRYPKAGDVLPRVEVRVLDLQNGRTVRLALGIDPFAPDHYVARVHWHPDGQRVAVERLNREQNRLDLLLCSATSGSCKLLAHQEQQTWVNLNDDLRFLPDGHFLWSHEDDGWRQLDLYGPEGQKLRRLTPKGWHLTSLDAVHVEPGAKTEGWIVFTAHATGTLGAAERHVFRASLKPGSAERLTEVPGWHSARVSATGHWVHRFSDANTPPRDTLRAPGENGQDAGIELPSRPPAFDPARLPQWRIFTISGPDGAELPAQVLEPPGFDPSQPYPVLMYHYGGPASQVVANRWRLGRKRGVWHKRMAELGYVVFSVDNPGSAFFGKRGADKMYRSFGPLELRAQLAGVEHLRAQPWVDPERIGLWGWSGGGSHTLYSLAKAPGVWAAGVAGAPLTDWRYYDAIWIERYLDRPQDNPEGYADSPLAHAAGLSDPVLLIHGTADNNVHPQNTYNFAQALIEAGRHFELGLYPNERHSLETFAPSGQRHVFERMEELFARYLRGGS